MRQWAAYLQGILCFVFTDALRKACVATRFVVIKTVGTWCTCEHLARCSIWVLQRNTRGKMRFSSLYFQRECNWQRKGKQKKLPYKKREIIERAETGGRCTVRFHVNVLRNRRAVMSLWGEKEDGKVKGERREKCHVGGEKGTCPPVMRAGHTHTHSCMRLIWESCQRNEGEETEVM